MYDSERDSFMIALKALGYSMNTTDLGEIQEAYEWLINQRDTMDPIRISARGFKEEIASAKQQMREEWQERRDSSKTYLFDSMTPELKSHMEDIRLGRKKKEEL